MKSKQIILVAFFAVAALACTAQKQAVKKTAKPANKTIAPSKKTAGPEASIISIVIEHNGEKTELTNTQFETWGDTTIPNGSGSAVILSYGASNSKKNDASFNWMFTIPKAEKGIYTTGVTPDGGGPAASLQFSSTEFPKIPMFLCKSGSITINDCPLPGGFVKGTFSVVLEGGVTTDGILDNTSYNMSGSFSILRQ